MKILKCVCFKCSKLKISKEKYREALSMSSDDRWNFVFKLASNINRCGNETNDGCGCKQPTKFKKEVGRVATLHAEWDFPGATTEEKVNIKLHAEMVLKILKRISDEDIKFMGFDPHWSRPEWMICQVLAVPPPAVRPSVKHDAQQRSEDDITHILCNIIKTNNTLKEKLNQNSASNIIEDWSTVLQYYVATLVDNSLPGVAQCCQRSGRPLKSIKERLNGKTGRVRGNLMGKRVDFSARSVITADPTLSIRQLGIPEKIAKNITKPVLVNDKNIKFLTKLVMNGPEIHPGAKILEKKNKRQISLRYVDKSSINIEAGDIVHRHMIDGDAILFNRQPTLHRMSMMCHIAKIMKRGDTFRMNVADTKPYNADFDGDEMNLHMPQNLEAESELRNLAAVPYQIVSPANNSCIVGIFQDSLLGAHQFTRENINMTIRDAMNLLMSYNNTDISKLNSNTISSYDILSQIMPNLSLKYKTKLFKEDKDEYNKSKNVLEIQDGEYLRGHMDKGVLGSGSKGLLHRICNDYGNMNCADFIDNFQNIITDYMKTCSFSVGISDLLSNEQTKTSIDHAITEKKNDVKHLMEQLHVGIFTNETGKSNNEEFETRVNNILNQASAQAGKIGRNNLSKDNRFVTMVNAGSKGSDLNISFMIACLGQQNVQGKRIPYGFNDRTLPHFNKYDDSPRARGFVENSYINGLDPDELFFHAMGGRTGLIDTAVKTSQTGYIQRRLIKGLEDLKVEYDMTVRNNMGKIVQYTYGDDGIDSIKIENQLCPLINMSNEDIHLHYHIMDKNNKEDVKILNMIFSKKIMTQMKKEDKTYKDIFSGIIDSNIHIRNKLVTNVNKNTDKNSIHIPVGFQYIINNIQKRFNFSDNSTVDISPLECYILVKNAYSTLKSYYMQPNQLFEAMYFYHMSPRNLLVIKRFNKDALILLIETIILQYKRSIVAPGEMVGMIAAQSIGEPTTQMTLNTFHFAGVSSKSNVTRGVPRIEEILSLTENVKNPSLTVHLKPTDEEDREKAMNYMTMIENTCLGDIIDFIEIRYEPDSNTTIHTEDQLLMEQFNDFEQLMKKCNNSEDDDEPEYYKWIVRMKLLEDVMLEKNITMNDIHYCIKEIYNNNVKCCFSDYNDDNLIFRISLAKKQKKNDKLSLDQSDDIYIIKSFQEELLNKVVLRGVRNINKVILRKIQNSMVKKETKFVTKEKWVLDTVGSNLSEVLGLDFIDSTKTITNNIIEVYHVLGIEAARQCIFDELIDVIEFDGTYINSHHIDMLCDRMCYNTKMVSIFRHGINNDSIGPIAKASFEETPEMFLKAARHAELDNMVGVSANIMCGQEGYFGTGSMQLILDTDKFDTLEYDNDEEDNKTILEDYDADECNQLHIDNNNNIAVQDDGDDDDYIPDF
jgi:DNA-directed RNA polymerase II subunit RPB1